MRALILTICLFAIACYSPKPPGGSYLCSSVDKECPAGQACECGLCIERPTQAACAFRIETAAINTTLSVEEHEAFSLTISSLTANGAGANEFGGEVTLASSWGDVQPNKVRLTNGTATVQVRLNRETLSPQTAKLSASFQGNTGQSGKIAVSARKFERQAEPVVAPATLLMPFGWANRSVSQPNVLRDGTGYRMYFVGSNYLTADSTGIGVATSSDGKAWTVQSEPIIITKGTGGLGADINSPSVFLVNGKYHAVVSKGDIKESEIALGTSTDGLLSWDIFNSGLPILKKTDCAYCNKNLNFPQVIPDPASLDATGNATSWILFFGATAQNSPFDSVSIARAQSSDGIQFTPEPAPVLSGELTGERLLFSPRVLVDGTVFKMWYSYASIGEINSFEELCTSTSKAVVGYATSDDGFYWIRSPSNPVLEPTAAEPTTMRWDQGARVILASSIVPTDGTDPQNGIDLYYTGFRKDVTSMKCLPNGIGKASRP